MEKSKADSIPAPCELLFDISEKQALNATRKNDGKIMRRFEGARSRLGLGGLLWIIVSCEMIELDRGCYYWLPLTNNRSFLHKCYMG